MNWLVTGGGCSRSPHIYKALLHVIKEENRTRKDNKSCHTELVCCCSVVTASDKVLHPDDSCEHAVRTTWSRRHHFAGMKQVLCPTASRGAEVLIENYTVLICSWTRYEANCSRCPSESLRSWWMKLSMWNEFSGMTWSSVRCKPYCRWLLWILDLQNKQECSASYPGLMKLLLLDTRQAQSYELPFRVLCCAVENGTK